MKKYLFILIAMMTTLFSISAMAFTPPPAPANGWYVLDQAGKLSTSDLNVINRKILVTSQATKNEFGVLILQSMQGDNIEDVAGSTFRAWGVGKHGLDNGILLVISVKDRKFRIETGKGVEGEVTDLQASDILSKDLAPNLRRGDYTTGIVTTLDSLDRLLESRHNAKVVPVIKDPAPAIVAPSVSNTNETSDSSSGHVVLFVVLGLLALLGIGFVIFTIYASYEEAAKRDELNRIKNNQKRDAAERERLEKEARNQHDRMVESVAVRNTTEYRRPAPVEVDTRTASQAAAIAATAELEQMRLQNERNKERRELERLRQRAIEREREREEDNAAAIAAAAVLASVASSSDDDDDDDDRSSGSSSDSSFSLPDFGGGDDDGGGFGGGDSGGGGASGDW